MNTMLKIEMPIDMVIAAPLDPATMKPATVYGSDEVKKVDGSPVYSIRVSAANESGYPVSVYLKVKSKPDKAIAASVAHPVSFEMVNPKTTVFAAKNGRVAYSVVADAIRFVDDKPVK